MRNAIPFLIGLLAVLGLGYLIWWDMQNPTISFLRAFFAGQFPSAIAVGLIGWRCFIFTKGKVPFSTVLRANGVALAGSIFVPMRLGDLAKPLYFKRVSDFPQALGLAVIVKERVWDLIGLAGFCLVVPLFAKNTPFSDQLTTIVPLVLVLGIVAYIGMLALPRIMTMFSFLKRFEAYTDAMRMGTWWESLIQLVFALTIWWSSFLIFYVFYVVSGLPSLSVFQLIVVFLAATLGLVATITPGGLGTYEGAIVAILAQFGVEWEAALAFAIGTRFCWMAIPLGMGLWALVVDGRILLQKSKS